MRATTARGTQSVPATMKRIAAGLLALCAAAGGCSEGTRSPAPPGEPGVAAPESSSSTSAKSVEVEVATLDEAGYARLLDESRGKVLLIDFWGTWCGPCKELFPHTVALHERFAGEGLKVVSVAIDEMDSRPAVEAFLVQNGAVCDNYLSPYGIGTRSFEVFDIGGEGLPHLKLYGRGGRLEATFDGADIDPDEIDRRVEELLGASGA